MRGRKSRRQRTGLIPLALRGCGIVARRVAASQVLLAALALGGAAWGVSILVRSTDAFHITTVAMPEGSALHIDEPLVGRNIWMVDLNALADALHTQQPAAKAIQVQRRLPDTIQITVLPRVPVAQVRLEGQPAPWFLVDADGFILPEGTALPQERLVQLIGFSRGALRPGRLHDDPRLQVALRVRARLKRSPAVISRLAQGINVADPEQIRLLLAGDMEVRCGAERDLDAQLERLRGALKAIAHQSMSVAYIDVRFQDPVVGPQATR